MSQQQSGEQNQQANKIRKDNGSYVGGDNTTFGDIRDISGTGNAIGTGAVANLTIYKGEGYSSLNYRNQISGNKEFYTKNFVGRRDEISRLIEFSAKESPGYLLVEANAGFGKSALIYQMLQRHEKDVWESHSKPYLLYFFIRKVDSSNKPVNFLQAINSQLLKILNLPGGVPSELSTLKNQFSELWSQALKLAKREQPLLLLVDGLDEIAEGGENIFQLLPSNLTNYTHVIATSRPNPKPLEKVNLEHFLRKADILRLQKFDESDIRELLQNYKFTVEVIANISQRVFQITKGEPLFVRFVCEDVLQKGESALSQLETNPPADVEAYFRQQFNQLNSLTDGEQGEIAWEILGLLVVTLGGITIQEIAKVLGQEKRKINKAVKPIQRFLLGDSQLTLMHLQLRKVLSEKLEDKLKENQKKLLNFCAKWEEHHSPYALRYYAEHLIEAGCPEKLHALLAQETPDGRNAWYEAKEKIGDTADFITDVSLAWEEAEKEFNQNPGVAIGRQCRYALMTASINSMATNIPVELLVALVEKNVWTPETGLTYALHNSNSNEKAASLIKLVDFLPAKLKQKALNEALSAARSIQNDKYRARVLSDLAPLLPEENLLNEALTAARSIQDEQYRAEALSDLVPLLPKENLLEEALAVARSIQNDKYRAEALSDLVPLLPKENLLEEALAVARSIQNDKYRAKALSDLAPLLPEENLLNEALAVARSTQDEQYRAEALSDLAPLLPTNLLNEALTAARSIQHDKYRAEALSDLAPLLPKNLLSEALTAARSIQHEHFRAKALSDLVPLLPEENLLNEALAAARSIQYEYYRALTLSELAPLLPKNLLSEALTAARSIQDDKYRARVLSDLAPFLPENLLDQALAITRSIQYEYDRAHALRYLAPFLPENLLNEALTAALSIQYEHFRADVLNNLAPLLPENLLEEALAAARSIQDEYYGADVLNNLAPLLPENLLEEALAAARSIQDEYYRALTLSELAPNPLNLLNLALRVARSIPDKYDGLDIVMDLAPKRLKNLFVKAVFAADYILNEEYRAQFLSNLAPKLTKNSLREALSAARSIQSEYHRAKALSDLAPKLPEENLLAEALSAARSIQDEFYRTKALSDLAPLLPKENLLAEALIAARYIEEYDEFSLLILGFLMEKLSQVEKNHLFPYWRDTLHILSGRARKDLLRAIGAFTPIIFSLGGKKGVKYTADAIKDVSRWWP